jgi:hypothetical protein
VWPVHLRCHRMACRQSLETCGRVYRAGFVDVAKAVTYRPHRAYPGLVRVGPYALRHSLAPTPSMLTSPRPSHLGAPPPPEVEADERSSSQRQDASSSLRGRAQAHRDIKPENMLFGGNGDQLKLCDFGSAAKFQQGPKTNSFSDFVSTAWYTAPEIFTHSYRYEPHTERELCGIEHFYARNRRYLFLGPL